MSKAYCLRLPPTLFDTLHRRTRLCTVPSIPGCWRSSCQRRFASDRMTAAAATRASQETQARRLSTLTSFIGRAEHSHSSLSCEDMLLLFSAISTGVKSIASAVSQIGIQDLTGVYQGQTGTDSMRDEPKKLDVVANEILKDALITSGKVAVLASEEDDEPIAVDVDDTEKYVVVFDPLDGSRNIDASIPTGTIFGIYRHLQAKDGQAAAEHALASALQPGQQLVAAGYALYSSATMLVITMGEGTHGFTLDSRIGEFVLTHPDMEIPKRGQIYSVNDARYFDWPKGLQLYIDTIRQGKGQHPKQYSARYICSLVADLHRTLLYGGIAMNPRSHLRLLYEANPLSFITEQAGGRGSDGKQRILEVQPQKVHERLPLFLGSPDDIAELESYDDVQQLHNPGYTV